MNEERRKYARQFMQLFVEVRTRPDDEHVVAVSGVTVNISRGGMLALLTDHVPTGSDGSCMVEFKESRGVVEPGLISGIIVRAERRGPDYEVAIQFPTILDTLSPPS